MNYNNLAQKTNFIAGSGEFENIPMFLTSVNIPGMSLNHPEVGGGRAGSRLNLNSDTVNWNMLSFELLIDEDFEIYKEIMRIVRKHINPTTGSFGNFSFDFFIEISNNKGNGVMRLEFENCRLMSVGDIALDTQDQATEHTMSMELVYDHYEINPVENQKIQIDVGTP